MNMKNMNLGSMNDNNNTRDKKSMAEIAISTFSVSRNETVSSLPRWGEVLNNHRRQYMKPIAWYECAYLNVADRPITKIVNHIGVLRSFLSFMYTDYVRHDGKPKFYPGEIEEVVAVYKTAMKCSSGEFEFTNSKGKHILGRLFSKPEGIKNAIFTPAFANASETEIRNMLMNNFSELPGFWQGETCSVYTDFEGRQFYELPN